MSELKRTKQKLQMFEIEGVYGLLADVIEETEKFADCRQTEYADKLMIIQKVRHKLLLEIKENENKHPKQPNLFT